MDNCQIVYPPNKPMTKMDLANVVPTIPKYLTFIDVNSKGQIILGSSDVAASWWNGTLFFYGNYEDAKDHVIKGSYIDETTVSDGKFIDDETIILAADTGRLTTINVDVKEDDMGILKATDFYYNSGRINQLDVWKSAKKAVTCSESAVSLWNLNAGIVPLQEYRNFHTDIVTSVNCQRDNDNMFLTGSWDKRVCLWDLRADVLATVINDIDMCPVTAVSFHPPSENYVFIGTISGHIYSLDRRNPKELLDKCAASESSIHRISSNTSRSGLAVCADAPEIKIFECTEGLMRFVYESTAHTGMARGIAWHDNDAYTCGSDSCVFQHFCM